MSENEIINPGFFSWKGHKGMFLGTLIGIILGTLQVYRGVELQSTITIGNGFFLYLVSILPLLIGVYRYLKYLRRMKKNKDGKVEPNLAKSTRVYVKKDGKWMLVHANFGSVN